MLAIQVLQEEPIPWLHKDMPHKPNMVHQQNN